jgi:hypothetical protein
MHGPLNVKNLHHNYITGPHSPPDYSDPEDGSRVFSKALVVIHTIIQCYNAEQTTILKRK